jgi:hypothetical protein
MGIIPKTFLFTLLIDVLGYWHLIVTISTNVQQKLIFI